MRNIIVFLLFFIITMLLYMPLFNVMIPGDNYWLFFTFNTKGINGMNEIFHDKAPLLFSYFFIYFLHLFIGKHIWWWIFISLIMHAANSFLVFRISNDFATVIFPGKPLNMQDAGNPRVSCSWQWPVFILAVLDPIRKFSLSENKNLFSFFSAMIFLMSPYQTETVAWSPANLFVQFSTCFAFMGIFLFIKYIRFHFTRYLLLLHLTFLLSVLSKENSIILPLLCIVIYFFLMGGKKPVFLNSFPGWVLFPQILIIFLYFSLTKILTGHWFWHAGRMEIPGDPVIYFGNFLKYLAKFIFFYRYLPNEFIDTFLRDIYKNKVIITVFSVSLAVIFIILSTILINKIPGRTGTGLIAIFLCFIVSLIPVLPLDTSFLSGIYPDRYGYFPSAFIYMFITGCIIIIYPELKNIFLAGYLAICLALAAPTIAVWKDVSSYCTELICNFKSFTGFERVYVLNVPAYYKGAAAMRSSFNEAIFYKYGMDPGKIKVISGTFQESLADTLHYVIKSGKMVTVKAVNGKRPYFNRHSGWAKSYRTHEYKVLYDSVIRSYSLIFNKEVDTNSVIIYSVNDEWKAVK